MTDALSQGAAPEAAVGLRPAGLVSRGAAFLVDIAFLALVTSVAVWVVQAMESLIAPVVLAEELRRSVLSALAAAFPLLYVAYFAGLWALSGRTIGKLLLGLRVVSDDGGRVTFARAVARCGGYVLSALPLYVGFAWVLVDPERRAWHDRLTRTRVVYDRGSARPVVSAAATMVAALSLAPRAASAQEIEGWRLVVEPYLFAPLSIEGAARIGDVEAEIDTRIDDYLPNLDGVVQLRGEAWYGRLGLIAETSWVALGLHTDRNDYRLDAEMFVGDFLASARVLTTFAAEHAEPPGFALDIQAGGRVAAYRQTLVVEGQVRETSPELGRVIVGLNVPMRFSTALGGEVRATVSAPGPELYFQALGELRVWLLGIRLGYRVATYELEGDDGDLAVLWHGPYLGLALLLEEEVTR